jgi:hypothetical protein
MRPFNNRNSERRRTQQHAALDDDYRSCDDQYEQTQIQPMKPYNRLLSCAEIVQPGCPICRVTVQNVRLTLDEIDVQRRSIDSIIASSSSFSTNAHPSRKPESKMNAITLSIDNQNVEDKWEDNEYQKPRKNSSSM